MFYGNAWLSVTDAPTDPTDMLDPKDAGDGFVMCPDCDNYAMRRHPQSGNPFAPRGYYRVPRCETCDREDGCYGEPCEEPYDVDYWEDCRRDTGESEAERGDR